jgi:LysR family transcriptional regulator, transcriptional activator for bauABCD operon
LELNIGVSTISRHIKDLELRLGLVLCRRGRAGFALTGEGERIHTETLRLLAATDGFRASVDDIHQRMGGELHVAVFDKTATNPAAHLGVAIAAFTALAPLVKLVLHVAPINTIERAVIAGEFQVGIIPAHRDSDALTYDELFGEAMRLYCGRGHPLFGVHGLGNTQNNSKPSWSDLRHHRFAGLGYHSPNMQISHQMRLPRSATGFDQESIATLILSGQFLGFLPDHYGRIFEAAGQMEALAPDFFKYDARFMAITRATPKPARAALVFRDCLVAAHAQR